MELEVWHFWIMAMILLCIIEVFAPTFLALCLAVGCLAAGVFSHQEFGLKMQLLVFSVGTMGAFFAVRPFMLKYAHRKSRNIATNVEALIGKTGRVVVTIDHSKNEGRVMVEGDDWKAESENNQVIDAGSRVQVVKIDSTILTVKPII